MQAVAVGSSQQQQQKQEQQSDNPSGTASRSLGFQQAPFHQIAHHHRHHDGDHDDNHDDNDNDIHERSWRCYDGWALARSINNNTNS